MSPLASLAAVDPRWLTAICDIVIGVALAAIALRVWWMPLHRRAVVFQPYLTGKGVALVLHAWPVVFITGALLIVSGLSRWAYWRHSTGDPFASGIGSLEAIFSLWAAGSVAVVAVRAWRGT